MNCFGGLIETNLMSLPYFRVKSLVPRTSHHPVENGGECLVRLNLIKMSDIIVVTEGRQSGGPVPDRNFTCVFFLNNEYSNSLTFVAFPGRNLCCAYESCP